MLKSSVVGTLESLRTSGWGIVTAWSENSANGSSVIILTPTVASTTSFLRFRLETISGFSRRMRS
jgi:hypothetical protein